MKSWTEEKTLILKNWQEWASRSGFFIFGLLCLFWLWLLRLDSVDIHQGEVYKILYIHVPNAFCAFFASFILCCLSFLLLIKKRFKLLPYAKATAEIGLVFTVLTLITGSIWGKPTWGTWWTWDARLTTTFLLAILYGAYQLLWYMADSMYQRAKLCSVVGILIFCDIPIIYKSVSWWRTLHQPPSLFGASGTSMSTPILTHLILSLILTLCFSLWLIWKRASNLKLEEALENKLMNNL